MSDIHALVGAYAVDAVDDLERARFEEHLAGCADCRAEVDGLRAAAAMLASATPVEPPPEMRTAVLAGISTVRPLPPLVTRQSPAKRRWVPFLAAAAAVLIAVGLGATWQPWRDDDTSVTLTAADRVLQAPDAEEVSAEVAGAEATLVRSKREGRAVLVTRDMPAAPAGKVYELWLQSPEGVMEPAGLMPDREDQTVLLEGDASDAVGAGITVEPDGGSPEPSTEPVVLFKFEKA
ncbi:anti-sigma factor [Nocardioides sp. LHG3406-4]|uniref:anti-sigma factor n=1 Tax=Nocardioides sp. LHG3406-4 TaxID=2804575 RepID=UPI003CF07339